MSGQPGRSRRLLLLLLLALPVALVQCQAARRTLEPIPTTPAETRPASLAGTGAATASPAVAAPARDAAPATTRPGESKPPAAVLTQVPAQPETLPSSGRQTAFEVKEYDVPKGSHPHDVAPAADGGVWYTAQAAGFLGWLDPKTGETERVQLGLGSAPHGVIVGPDGAAWVTDGGLNAVVRIDAESWDVTMFNLPPDRDTANLNTAAFDAAGRLWFTGQSGIYGVLDPATGHMDVYDAPKGRGPYGITATPAGKVYFASLAGSYVGEIDPESGKVTVLEPPTAKQGARRVWSDSDSRVWVSEWDAGQLGRFDPETGLWKEWPLPGPAPRPYAVYVDWQDMVWVSDFSNHSLVRFDPVSETFATVSVPQPSPAVRQLHGRPGEIWGAESAADKLVVVRVR